MCSLYHDRLTTYSFRSVLRNLRLTPNEYVRKFPAIVSTQCCHFGNNTCHYPAGKLKPLHPSILCPFPPSPPPASRWLPTRGGGDGAPTARGSDGADKRRGSLKSNFTLVQLHYEKINDLEGNTVVMARGESMNDAHHGYYFSLFFVLLTVT